MLCRQAVQVRPNTLQQSCPLRQQVQCWRLALEHGSPVGTVRHMLLAGHFHQTGQVAGGHTQHGYRRHGTLVNPAVGTWLARVIPTLSPEELAR